MATNRRSWAIGLALALATLGGLAAPAPARAGGKVAWLDDIVRQVVREAEAEGKVAARGAEHSAARAGRLFARETDEGLEALARRSDDLARAAHHAEQPAEALLDRKFARLIRGEPEAARTFRTLAPAEKRLVVAMGETAQRLARRYPGEAEGLIRKLGVEGMTAVRVYGDDVAEVIAREGSRSVDVLRKTGRGGWSFFTGTVLPHKKKLIAAGVLALFLADPDKFVDTAGHATRYAAEQFARAGVRLAGFAGDGAARGIESALGHALAARGIDSAVARKVGMGLAGVVAVLAGMILLGLPLRWAVRPLTWPVRLVFGKRRAARAA